MGSLVCFDMSSTSTSKLECACLFSNRLKQPILGAFGFSLGSKPMRILVLGL